MALGYGSTVELPKLSALEIGPVLQEVKHSSLWSFLRILITIAEVGLSLIPGVGIIGSTALTLGAAAANTIIDYEETGKVTPVSLAINFGAALIPGAVGGIKNVASAAKWNTFLVRESESLLDTAAGLKATAQSQADLFAAGSSNALGSMIAEAPFAARNPFINAVASGSKKLGKTIAAEFGQGADASLQKILAETLRKQALGQTIGTALGDVTEGVEEDIRKIEFNAGITRQETATLDTLLRGVSTTAEKQEVVVMYLRNIGKLDSLRKLAPLATDAELVNIMRNGEKLLANEPWSFKNTVRNYIRSLKRPASSEFNDNFVQKVQLLFDGNDAGRAPIEFAYGKIKKYISKQFKRLGKLISKADKIDDLFTKTGGTLVNSEVIIGYKIIESIGYQNLVQITFYPDATRSAKNPQGKEPVFVFANKQELKRLRNRGMSYYLKKWATSKNGRTGLGFGQATKGILGALTFFSGFFKINAIRNILSLASNISTGFLGEGGIAEHGMFTSGWEKKFASSFSRNWKNRLGRLTGRAIIGGAAGAVFGHRIGSFVGREAQRASSQYIVPLLTGQKMGSFKNALATSFQSQLRGLARRRAVKTGNTNFVVKSLSTSRNAGIVQRAPGSFTAGKAALTNWKVPIIR